VVNPEQEDRPMAVVRRCPRCGHPLERCDGEAYCPNCTVYAQVSFDSWMARVDEALVRKVGVSSNDLPDFTYRDLLDAGCTPEEAADTAIDNAVS
jgi:hypothetical protein